MREMTDIALTSILVRYKQSKVELFKMKVENLKCNLIS